jgi:hypothetical protein
MEGGLVLGEIPVGFCGAIQGRQFFPFDFAQGQNDKVVEGVKFVEA